MNESFGLRRSIQVQGIAFTLLFLAATVGCAGLFLFDEPKKHGFEGEHSVAIVACSGIAVFGGMALISAYMLIAYHVERFSIAGTRISIRSVFQQRQFDQSEVDKLTWKTNPIDGQLVFHVVNRNARLELHGFRREDRLRMVRLLRQLIPEAKQEGWPLFCLKIALPLRNRCEPQSILENPCSRDEVFITRWRYDRLFLALLPLTIIGAVAAWWWTELDIAVLRNFRFRYLHLADVTIQRSAEKDIGSVRFDSRHESNRFVVCVPFLSVYRCS